MDEAVTVRKGRALAWRPLRAFSDAALARAAAGGDRSALGVIFERHHQALYRYCRSLLGNDADAQDALQNTMARVVRALPGERREIALRPWLYRIAHNESLRLVRARRPQGPLEEAGALAAPDGADGDVARERVASLMADLRELPERQRAALVMRELNGLGFEEIGTALGMSAVAAKQAVYEARVALQEFEQGRAMRCEDVMRAVSDGDRRRLRGRAVRAHLRECGGCLEFRAAIERRAGELRALAPPLAAPAAAAILGKTVGGGGSAGGGGVLAVAGGGAAKAAAPAAAIKLAATVAVVATTGAGVAALGPADLAGEPAARSETSHSPTVPASSTPAGATADGSASDRRQAAVQRRRKGTARTRRDRTNGRRGGRSTPAAEAGVRQPGEGRVPVAGGAAPSGSRPDVSTAGGQRLSSRPEPAGVRAPASPSRPERAAPAPEAPRARPPVPERPPAEPAPTPEATPTQPTVPQSPPVESAPAAPTPASDAGSAQQAPPPPAGRSGGPPGGG